MQATIEVENLNEENKGEKFARIAAQLRKAVSLPCVASARRFQNIRHSQNADLRIVFKSFSGASVEKALRNLSFGLGVPLKSGKGEGFVFRSQEELTDAHAEALSRMVQGVYGFAIEYFGLPKVDVVSKAVLEHKGKVLYSPETGKPIERREWDAFVSDLEKFLNRNSPLTGEKIVLEAAALGRILDRMLENNSLEAVRKTPLDGLKYKGKTFDWISESTKNMAAAFGGSFSRGELGRLEMLSRSAGEKLKRASEGMKSNVKQALIDGVLNKKGKSQVSQDLFDRLVGSNRDFQKIADTETQRAFNDAFLSEEVANAEEGETIYFKRLEVIDENTCAYCKKINGTVARWSATPLKDGAIKDEWADVALWEGKEADGKLSRQADAPSSVCHPYCRGVWVRSHPEKEAKLKDALKARGGKQENENLH